MNSIDSLAIVEIETHAGELAGRLLGQILLELETVSDAQHAVPGLPGGRLARAVAGRPRSTPGGRPTAAGSS